MYYNGLQPLVLFSIKKNWKAELLVISLNKVFNSCIVYKQVSGTPSSCTGQTHFQCEEFFFQLKRACVV